MNSAWHRKNKMASKATLEGRISWHLAHLSACGCRAIPKALLLEMRARGIRPPSDRRGVTWAMLRRMALALPGVEEGTSYGTPAFHVGRKLLFRLKEDGASIAIKVGFADRDVLLELDPQAFYLTDHYRPYPAMLVRLSHARPEQIKELLKEAWARAAPRALLAREGRHSRRPGLPEGLCHQKRQAR
jgi:hypothetical protein